MLIGFLSPDFSEGPLPLRRPHRVRDEHERRAARFPPSFRLNDVAFRRIAAISL
jgi:hypothetical protein